MTPRSKPRSGSAIEYILAHQQADGWLGPDWRQPEAQAVRRLAAVPAVQGAHAIPAGDRRSADHPGVACVLPEDRRGDLAASRCIAGPRFRAADLAVVLYWLHEQTGEPWVLDLAKKAFAQSHDWRALYENFPFKDKAREKEDLENHGVNTAMG